MIYGCYGVWHSTLELNAREEQVHASSYRRYDDHLDDTFSPDDDLYPQDQAETPYQGWSAPEERGHQHQQDNQYQEEEAGDYEESGEQHGYQSGGRGGFRAERSRGRTNQGFDADEDYD